MNTEIQLTQLDNGNLCIVVPMLIKRMRGRKAIIVPDAPSDNTGEFSDAVQLPLAKAVARAFAWTEALESGRYADITALATALGVDSAYIRRILDLANLSPALVEAILRGEEPDGLSLARLRKGFPEAWGEQKNALTASPSGK